MSQEQSSETLIDDARAALEQAVKFSWACQQPDGHWVAPVSADATLTAQYVMLKYAIPGLFLEKDAYALKKWLFADQTEEGSWALAPGLPGNLSTSIEAYLALRLLGVSATHPAMRRACDFILSKGGIPRARFFTRLFLATFGLFPWSAMPQVPVELILIPTWAPLNVYALASWARSVFIPLLLFCHHEPVYSLPNGRSPENDFLDELWPDPFHKDVPVAPPLWDLFWGEERDVIKWLCVAGDRLIRSLGGLKKGPLRRIARRKCVGWLLEHQEEEGNWGGIFPASHASIWALLLEGFPLEHEAVRLGLEAMERFAVTDAKGKWLQSCVSPTWDTALMATALCDAGHAGDPRLGQAAEWLRDHQVLVDHGDWRIYSANSQAGGWSFEYYNTFYPDVDDTAAVIIALVKQNPSAVASDCVLNGVTWILGMQNRDGGWGGFDTNNDAHWLHKHPVNDMDALIDPSTSDLTGRVLECFGLLLANRKGVCLPRPLQLHLNKVAKGALEFLLAEQECEGAASGAWFGRWGSNYIYGTAEVLRGLHFWCHENSEVASAAMQAILWLRQCQRADGGWGETLLSYDDPSLAGQGDSTSAQTAWAVDAMLRYLPPSDPATTRGIRWLVFNQTVKCEDGEGMSWRSDTYVGTGFPTETGMYLGYPYYRHHFAIQAISGYIEHSALQALRTNGPYVMNIPPDILSTISRPELLVIVSGGHKNIDDVLSTAKWLPDYRICIAADPHHRGTVQKHGLGFRDVESSSKSPSAPMETRPFIADIVIFVSTDAAETALREHPDLLETNRRCALIPELKADWQHKVTGFLLSGAAATSLIHAEALVWDDLEGLKPVGLDKGDSSSCAWMKVLYTLTDCFFALFSPLFVIITRIIGLFDSIKLARATGRSPESLDSTRQARIRRGEFDLHLIVEHMDEDEAHELDGRLARIWESQVAAKFHEEIEGAV